MGGIKVNDVQNISATPVLEKNALFVEASAFALREKRRVQTELLAKIGVV